MHDVRARSDVSLPPNDVPARSRNQVVRDAPEIDEELRNIGSCCAAVQAGNANANILNSENRNGGFACEEEG